VARREKTREFYLQDDKERAKARQR